ncbi:integrase [Aureimonas flava]|uniref:Integrase n=1 Tax=Aureimonas flava TaxID=2320271 RepID=A0A3A1WJT6_9HYPH|nr:site-specific integrase [Aureimonas flava]RIY00866.1 integrase [Aureimonas flava]
MKGSFRHVVEDVDRHGNVRIYYRKPGGRKIRLRGPAGSADFLEDYQAAVAGRLKPKATAATIGEGSLRWVCVRYFQSAAFRGLEPVTQRVRRGILERLCEKEGEKPFAKMRPVHIRRRQDIEADRPEAANAMVKALRQLYKFAIEDEIVDRNHAADVAYLKGNPDGFHAWTLKEIDAYEDRHPVGSKARLALALLLYTAQRREDVRLFGPQHVEEIEGERWLVFRQNKNRNRKPVDLGIPIIDELQRILDASKLGEETFLVSEFGRPFASGTSFYNRFKKWCRDAGVGHCAPHGLRKAAASRMAELGCTDRQIMSITGHTTSKEIDRYTRGARQRTIAGSAGAKLSGAAKVPPKDAKEQSGTNSRSNALQSNEN